MKIRVKSTGEIKYAVYATTKTGNKRYNVDDKFYTDKQFDKTFEIIADNSDKALYFRVDTMKLLHEIADGALALGKMGVLKVPLNVLRINLGIAAEIATRINDPELNIAMIDLGLYEIPYDKVVKTIEAQRKLIKQK